MFLGKQQKSLERKNYLKVYVKTKLEIISGKNETTIIIGILFDQQSDIKKEKHADIEPPQPNSTFIFEHLSIRTLRVLGTIYLRWIRNN